MQKREIWAVGEGVVVADSVERSREYTEVRYSMHRRVRRRYCYVMARRVNLQGADETSERAEADPVTEPVARRVSAEEHLGAIQFVPSIPDIRKRASVSIICRREARQAMLESTHVQRSRKLLDIHGAV